MFEVNNIYKSIISKLKNKLISVQSAVVGTLEFISCGQNLTAALHVNMVFNNVYMSLPFIFFLDENIEKLFLHRLCVCFKSLPNLIIVNYNFSANGCSSRTETIEHGESTVA